MYGERRTHSKSPRVPRGESSSYTKVLATTLPTHNKFSNFFVVEILVVFRRRFFLDRELYLQNHPPKPRRETMAERAARYRGLMDENGWTRAELARQLGVSRAWVTKVLSLLSYDIGLG